MTNQIIGECIDCSKKVTYSLRKGRCSWCDKKFRNDDADGELHKIRCEKYRKTHPKYSSNKHRETRYGLSSEQFEQLLILQDGKCKICLKPFSHVPYVDHDHKTEIVRSLLCRGCNAGIGFLKEDPFIFERAQAYLEYHGCITPSSIIGKTSHADLRRRNG